MTQPVSVALKNSLSDSSALLAFIKEAVEIHSTKLSGALKADTEDLGDFLDSEYACSFGDEILLQVTIGYSHAKIVDISATHITGFFAPGVQGGLRRDGLEDFKSSMSIGGGGERLDGITEAQAYANKGRAIQIVAEALSMAECDGELAAKLYAANHLTGDARHRIKQRQEELRNSARRAVEESMEKDPDLVRMTNVDEIVDAMKSMALSGPRGHKVVLAYRDPWHTKDMNGEDLMSLVAFNASSPKRSLTAHYFCPLANARHMTHIPMAGISRFDKIALKDIPTFLSARTIFLSKSQSDAGLAAAIANQ